MKSEKCGFSFSLFKYLSVLFHSPHIFFLSGFVGFAHGYMLWALHISYLVKMTIFLLSKTPSVKKIYVIVYCDQSQYFNNELITFFEEFETLEKCYAKWPWKLECTWFLFEADVTLRFSNGFIFRLLAFFSFEMLGGNLADIVQWICGLAMTVQTNDEQNK